MNTSISFPSQSTHEMEWTGPIISNEIKERKTHKLIRHNWFQIHLPPELVHSWKQKQKITDILTFQKQGKVLVFGL